MLSFNSESDAQHLKVSLHSLKELNGDFMSLRSHAQSCEGKLCFKI